MTTDFEGLVEALYPALFSRFADLHAHPEVGFAEHRTSALVAEHLANLGLSVHRPSEVTGVLGILANGPGPVVALRADIDALPLTEQTGLPYSSEHTRSASTGAAMHACGHDIHTVSLLGAIEGLVARRSDWRGTVLAIAQPAEELGEGARRFIASGVLDHAPAPGIVIGQHVGSGEDALFSSRAGVYEAGQRNWRVTASGAGGHAAGPHRTVNPLSFASQLITRLQAATALTIDARERAVLVPTSVHAGGASNIIPTSATLTFCARAFSESVLDALDEEVNRIARGIAVSEGIADLLIERFSEFPVNINDDAALATVRLALDAEFGAGSFREGDALLGSEDFGEFGRHWSVPSVYWHFDAGASPHVQDQVAARRGHAPSFAPDPELALRRGTRALLATAWRFLDTGTRAD